MRVRSFILIAVCAAMAGSADPSAQVTTKFRADRARWKPDYTGMTEHEILENRLRNPFASPGVGIQKVPPGSTLSVTVRGEFPAGTTILSERDGVTLSGAALSTTSDSARLTIPPEEGPGFVRIWAFTPKGISGPTAVALVDTFYRFDLKSPEGYTVKVSPLEKTFTISDANNTCAHVKYQAEFYRPGESKPFETGTGDQTFYAWDEPLESRTPYARLEIDVSQSTTSPEAELEAIGKKMSDPKTTEAERNALMARMGEVQRKMQDDMIKGFQADPASLNKKQDDFGCGSIQLFPMGGGVVEGRIACGRNFNGGELKVTGTMTQVR